VGFVRLDHLGLVAYTIEEARAILGDQLGLKVDEERSNWPKGSFFAPEQTHNFFFQVGDGETQVEVLIPEEGATSGTARYLAKHGPGLHHMCFAARDVAEEAERLKAAGMRQIDLPRTSDGRQTAAFFHPTSVSGVLTEIVPLRD
jgi:methylmalonyl-CoA/ethylmalonyl-CoA epimerase